MITFFQVCLQFWISKFPFCRIKHRLTGFLANLSVTQAKNLSRYPEVPGQKLRAISVKTTRAIVKTMVQLFRAIPRALLVILVFSIPPCLSRPHPRTREHPVHYEPLSLTLKFQPWLLRWPTQLPSPLSSPNGEPISRASSPPPYSQSPHSTMFVSERKRESMQGSTIIFEERQVCA